MNRTTIFVVAILMAVASPVCAQTFALPSPSFTPSTAISASAMNANFSAIESAIKTLRVDKLNSANWAYASSVLSYTPTDGYVGIGLASTVLTYSTQKYFLKVTQKSDSSTICIANTNNASGGVDPNMALSIIGGRDTGNGGALIQFYTPNGTRLGWIKQTGADTIEFSSASDRRLKDGIVDTHYSLDQLMKIKVRDFFFKSDPDKKIQDGFIAQELYEAYPEAVSKPASEDGTWGVDYGRLSPILVKSIQDQQKEIEALKQENAELKARLAAIEKKLGM